MTFFNEQTHFHFNHNIASGIGDMLLSKSEQMKQQKEQVTVTVTPAAKKTTKGFEINSPKSLTPSGSGRNSPDEEMKQNKVKEAIRNGRELFEKERGDEKQQIHLVVIGHVDAGKSTMMGHLLYGENLAPLFFEYPSSFFPFRSR